MIQNWSIMLSVPEVRAARGLLGWSQTDLGRAAGLSLPTIKRWETGNGPRVSDEAVAKMRQALEAAGVEFIGDGEISIEGGPGVRLRKDAPR